MAASSFIRCPTPQKHNRNIPDPDTGAALPAGGDYSTYYIGAKTGKKRLLIDKTTGQMYYTNNHYLSFWLVVPLGRSREVCVMRTIELNAFGWKHALDFYDALLAALGAPEWHGRSVNALADTMIWSDEINAVKPPYVVKVANLAGAPAAVREEVRVAKDWLETSRAEFRDSNGRDVDVRFELA